MRSIDWVDLIQGQYLFRHSRVRKMWMITVMLWAIFWSFQIQLSRSIGYFSWLTILPGFPPGQLLLVTSLIHALIIMPQQWIYPLLYPYYLVPFQLDLPCF